LSDSDGPVKPTKPSWPVVEQRLGVRRSGRARRVISEERTAEEERRQAERRSPDDRRDESGWQPVPLDTTLADVAETAEGLITIATTARQFAQAHYSRFKVGAALETAEGTVVTGCNIENATYGLTLCAERVALVKGLSEGHTVFTRIAVVADTDDLTPPCGPCRQLLWEYCGDIEIILANLKGTTSRYRLSALLPMPFDARLLG
jgi:cytidine deaminase